VAEKLTLGLTLTVIALSITFFVLLLLPLTMNTQFWVFNRSRPARKPLQPRINETAAAAPPATEREEPATLILSPQLVATIMGAIATCTGQPVQKFRLISIRQPWDEEASSAWRLHHRMNVINRRNSFYSKGGTK